MTDELDTKTVTVAGQQCTLVKRKCSGICGQYFWTSVTNDRCLCERCYRANTKKDAAVRKYVTKANLSIATPISQRLKRPGN